MCTVSLEKTEARKPRRISFDIVHMYIESMMQLLSPLVSRPESKGVDLEKQVARLQELLQESEDQITALRNQERVRNR
jgi:hypothetical protein